MTYYNLTFMDNTTGIVPIITGVNEASGGWLIGLFLIILWVMIFMVFKDTDIKTLLLGSSFFMSLLTGLFFGLGLVQPWVLAIPVVILFFSLVIKIWTD